ncbi:MAG: hypothetical protein J6C92_14795 [Bacteroidaceae bacterium]|nr:hypothetical protein [Bacteroidaceae bacterium]
MKKYIVASNKSVGKKVYIVVSGCYSDYYPVGVYSTIEKAEEVAEKERELAGCDAVIEEFEIDALPNG